MTELKLGIANLNLKNSVDITPKRLLILTILFLLVLSITYYVGFYQGLSVQYNTCEKQVLEKYTCVPKYRPSVPISGVG